MVMIQLAVGGLAHSPIPVSKAEQVFSRGWRDAALVPRTHRSPSTFAPWSWSLRWRDGAIPVIHQDQGLRPQCGHRVLL